MEEVAKVQSLNDSNHCSSSNSSSDLQEQDHHHHQQQQHKQQQQQQDQPLVEDGSGLAAATGTTTDVDHAGTNGTNINHKHRNQHQQQHHRPKSVGDDTNDGGVGKLGHEEEDKLEGHGDVSDVEEGIEHWILCASGEELHTQRHKREISHFSMMAVMSMSTNDQGSDTDLMRAEGGVDSTHDEVSDQMEEDSSIN